LLLLAQALGLAHGVSHGLLGAGVPAHGEACESHGDGQPGHHALWAGSHEAGDVQCRLIDQLGHADAPAPAASGWTAPAPTAVPLPATQAAAPRTRPRAAHRARAPPT